MPVQCFLNENERGPESSGAIFVEGSKMKINLWVATLLAVGAGSVGASALNDIPLSESRSLNKFTLSVLNTLSPVCPSALGLRAANGQDSSSLDFQTEQGLIIGSQTVAPMTRFLSSLTCNAANPSRAEGFAFAAEQVSVVASHSHLAACITAKGPTDCSATPNSGLKQSGTLANGSYTIGANSMATHVQGWQDVLRLIYLGMPNSAGRDPDVLPNASPVSRDCNSAARQDLVNHWSNLFENGCEATGGPCTQLNHAFRPDLLSTSADVFRELIGAKLFPFCNARFAGDKTASDYPTTLANGASVFDELYQDFDPIRRTCVGGQNGGGAALPNPKTNADGSQSQDDYPATPAEQVCSPKGTLGVVLPISPPVYSGRTIGDLYPTKPCLKGSLVFGPAPKLPGTSKSTLCPNGDVTLGNGASDYDSTTGAIANSSNVCLVPAASDGDLRCINGKNNFNAPLDPPNGVIPAAQRDGRVFNLHLYNASGGYRSDSRLGGARNVVGDFARLHATRTLLSSGPTCPGVGGDTRCCEAIDASMQTGCLAETDHCSIGLASSQAVNAIVEVGSETDSNPEEAISVDIGGVSDARACVITDQYPLGHRVYLNTAVGFENVTGQELALAKCFAGGVPNFNTLLSTSELVPLPNGPVCQDFPEQSLCGSSTANDACVNNPVGIPSH